MWKKTYRIVLNIIIVVGTILTLTTTILAILIQIIIGGSLQAIAPNPEMENFYIFMTIITGITTFLLCAFATFWIALRMGLTIEIAEDIEQIKINTSPAEPIPEEEPIDINKYIYPYQ